MLYVRFEASGRTAWGTLEGGRVRVLEGDLFGERRPSGEELPLEAVRLLAPVRPWKILAAAVNYPSHVSSARAVIQSDEAPQVPQLFLKPASSVIGPGDVIRLPAGARRVDAEGELVAVIGRRCRSAGEEEALGYIFGYTCGNDVSARHWQRDDVQWWRAKGSDTFSPLGPVIATDLDPAALLLRTRVNGEVRQETSTGAMVHSLAKLIAFASAHMTLEPGDVIYTGTPGVTPTIEDGDVVEVEIEGIGVLRNRVEREGGPAGG